MADRGLARMTSSTIRRCLDARPAAWSSASACAWPPSPNLRTSRRRVKCTRPNSSSYGPTSRENPKRRL